MVELVKFDNLAPTAILSLVLKVLTILCMSITIFIPILTVQYTGSGIDIVMNIFSFNASLIFKQGTTAGIPTHFSTGLLNLFFILVVLGIIISIIFLVIQKNRYGAITNTFSILVLFILFLNYYIVNNLTGQSLSGITITISDDIGFYLIIVALMLLFVSSFTKFDLKGKESGP